LEEASDNLEAVGSSEILEAPSNTARCYNPENTTLNTPTLSSFAKIGKNRPGNY
jgi:hypothetical protein